MHQPSDHSGISAQFARLLAAVLEHLLALSSLASWEAKQGLRQTLLCVLLLFFALIVALAGYLLLLSLFVIVATSLWHLSLLFTLSLLTLSHFLAMGLLLFFLYRMRPTSIFKLTRAELLNDIEALTRD